MTEAGPHHGLQPAFNSVMEAPQILFEAIGHVDENAAGIVVGAQTLPRWCFSEVSGISGVHPSVIHEQKPAYPKEAMDATR